MASHPLPAMIRSEISWQIGWFARTADFCLKPVPVPCPFTKCWCWARGRCEGPWRRRERRATRWRARGGSCCGPRSDWGPSAGQCILCGRIRACLQGCWRGRADLPQCGACWASSGTLSRVEHGQVQVQVQRLGLGRARGRERAPECSPSPMQWWLASGGRWRD